MEAPNNTAAHVPEEIGTKILVKLPLRSISRFKSVCKTWKSATESVYFRCLFVSLHQNTFSCWSLLFQRRELIDFHGCKTWGLPKSLGSYIQNMKINGKYKFEYIASSNGLVLMHRFFGTSTTYVGNPVLQQWVEIPTPPNLFTVLCGLVTLVDEDSVVLSFKVVRTASMKRSQNGYVLSYFVYLSETGIWIYKQLYCPVYSPKLARPMSMNGTFYFYLVHSNISGQRKLMAHDFYGESNKCQFIPLPDQDNNHRRWHFKTALTTSSGFVMYVKTFSQRGDNLLKVWRLINDDSAWQLMWEITLPFIQFDKCYYAQVAMHPFDSNIVYFWSQEHRYLISCNLQTQNYKIFGDDESQHQDCFINQSACEKHMDQIYEPISGVIDPVILYQFVLPRWMESVPRPPQVEIINTTSLLSHVPSRDLVTYINA
ncbi:PREDICTED: putative F-box/kelch-repeat protein At4g22430 [Camelina sativa]|uniref:F-box/kelch-repeat protein At4g22430 n=1 Tax=Camelina sativa TaxID=90675 RepID=A0ABM1QQN4_CAMSA|nr:PREDICTED: putative F-box/kelch-repeat protein At4g22430 [Camelina sativa]